VDAGAYTGLSSVFFAMRYPESQIIAIEPSDGNFAVLVRNSERFKNIEPVHAALWGQSGWLTLADPGHGAWSHQVREKRDMIHDNNQRINGNNSQLVRAITLSDVIRDYEIDRIDLLKLDIEGSEREVFSDYDSWIGQVDSILMELHDRFRTGCSRSFFKAVDEFPVELWRGENVLVMRNDSPLRPTAVAEQQSIRDDDQQYPDHSA
jgi:FkbM family methyltransferase